jgi:trans-aconitate methyltransferase
MNVQTYQWNAIDYAKSSGVQQQWARELISKLGLKGNERLLDIGSGDGKVTAEIAGCLPNGSVIGIDSSEAMIELIPKDAVHQNRTDFKAWIRTTWLPYTQRVPDEKREIFIARLADDYIQQHSVDENGRVHVHMMRLEVEAVKR